jgi:hypothetical protein
MLRVIGLPLLFVPSSQIYHHTTYSYSTTYKSLLELQLVVQLSKISKTVQMVSREDYSNEFLQEGKQK